MCHGTSTPLLPPALCPAVQPLTRLSEEIHELRLRPDPNLPGQGLGVLWSCSTFSYSFGSSSCSGSSIRFLPDLELRWHRRSSLKASIGRSPSAATVSSSGTGWKTVNLSVSATACAATSGGVSIITNALSNSGTVGVGEHYTGGSAYFYTYAYASGSRNSHLLITYSGGTDADAPTSDFVPYTGIDSYIEGGERSSSR